MNYKTFKNGSKWCSLVTAAISLITITFVKWTFVFDSGNTAGKLILILIGAAVLTLIFGVIALPRWQGFVALVVFGYVGYCILFTPLYALS